MNLNVLRNEQRLKQVRQNEQAYDARIRADMAKQLQRIRFYRLVMKFGWFVLAAGTVAHLISIYFSPEYMLIRSIASMIPGGAIVLIAARLIDREYQ